MAKAEIKEGSSFHGVLHWMTAEDMAKLDKIEGVATGYYARTPVNAKLYDGKVQACTVYMEGEGVKKMKEEGTVVESKPPSERYIAIMTEGATHFGVKEEEI